MFIRFTDIAVDNVGPVIWAPNPGFGAEDIAIKLCKHSDWLTHARSIKISDFKCRPRIYNKKRERNSKID